MFSLAKGAGMILIWPIWSHGQKFLSQGLYLTSHGQERIKQRKKFLKDNIISSRSTIVEICTEATFQPLLQLYLLLPKLLSEDYHSLLEQDISEFFSDVPRLQFWAIVTSCLGLSWSFNAYQTSKKTGALDFEANLWGRLVLLTSCICQITSRLFVFVLFAYACGDGHFYPMVVFVVSHMLLMTLLYKLTTEPSDFNNRSDFACFKPTDCTNSLQKFYQCLLNGISNIFLFNDILPLPCEGRTQNRSEKEEQRERTKKRQVLVDAILAFESIILIIISASLVKGIPPFLITTVATLHALGLILKVVYYKNLHIWSGRQKLLAF